MSARHTPGPWEASAWTAVKNGELIAMGWEITANGHLLPLSAYAAFDDDTGEPESNARLIAAAPQLLRACEQAVEWLEGWASAEPYIGVLRAAIAKATGSTA